MTRTTKTRLGCEPLEVRECPAALIVMDSPDLRRDSGVTQPPAADTRVLVSPPVVTSGTFAKGIIINF